MQKPTEDTPASSVKVVIVRNAVRCNICGEVIESKHQHDYVMCKCGACAVDGGHSYLRRSFVTPDCYTELTETQTVSLSEG